MKKTIIISLVTAGLLVIAGTAQAGNKGYRNGHGPNHSYSSNRHYGYQPRRYSHRNYRHGYYGHHSSRSHVRNGLKIAAGALVIGSIIHAANNYRRDRVVVHRRSAPVRSSDYWYRIDNNGECVEVTLNSQGQEVWTYVNQGYCN